MKKNKTVLTGLFGLAMCGMLTSCDYSDFSLFGFFYHIHEDKVEESLKKPGSDTTASSSSSSSSSSTSSSSDDPGTEIFVTQTYLNTLPEKTLEGGAKIQGYQLLGLLTEDKAVLISYEKYVPTSGSAHTYSSYQSISSYTRNKNILNFSFSSAAYVNRSDTLNVVYNHADDGSKAKEAFASAFGSDTGSFLLKEDGTFVLGDKDEGSLASGLSTANTYFDYDESSRPTYKVVTLLDNGDCYLNSFAFDSKNPNSPVSSFVTKTTYQKIDDKSTSDYDVVHVNLGRGHMYANNNGSDMEFDIMSDASFNQWVGMSVGQIHSYKVTKTGFEGILGTVKPYGFEVMTEEAGEDKPTEEKDVLEDAVLVLQGSKNKDIRLGFFADKTYRFVWSAYKIDEQGTYEYDKENGKVILTTGSGENIKTNEIVKNEADDDYSIHYVSKRSAQLTQDFSLTQAQFSKYFQVTSLMSLKGDKNEKITLELLSDGSFVFEFEGTPAKEEGTYSYDSTKDVLTLKVNDTEVGKSVYSDGLYVISYQFSKNAQLTQTYSVAKAEFGKVFVHSLASLRGEVMNENCVLTFNSDFTTNLHMYVAAQSKTYELPGTYTVLDDGNVEVKNQKGGVACTSQKLDDSTYVFNYSSGLTQTFKMDSESFRTAFSSSDVMVNGVKNPDKTSLSLNHDHTYSFGFAFSGSWRYEVGGWKYDATKDKFVLTLGGTVNELTKQADGTYKGKYVAHVSSQLSQEFVIPDTDFLPKAVVSIEKNNASGTKFGFIFYSDHSFAFHFYTYGVTEKGTWSYDSTADQFLIRCNRNLLTVSKDANGDYPISYVSYKSAQMTQDFTLTSEEALKVKAVL